MLDRKTRIKNIADLGAQNYLLTLSAPEQARLVRPGQFLMLKCVEDVQSAPLLRRPFTIFNIHRSAHNGKPSGLELLVKDVGIGTHQLVGMKPGRFLQCLGPLGRGFQLPADLRSRVATACLVAGGVGIAPLLLLAESLLALRVRPILFYGGGTAADLVLRESFERLGIDIIYATQDGSHGEQGLVTEPLAQYLRLHSRQDTRIYACGPWGMMKRVHMLAVEHDLQCEVSLEARMGCALGACLGCVVAGAGEREPKNFLRVCQEGPVIDSRRIQWEIAPV